MKKEIYLMPEKCAECGEVFDMSYDFKSVSGDNAVEDAIRKIRRDLDEVLCWTCRQEMIAVSA